MWDLIVSAPDHCLSFYFDLLNKTESIAWAWSLNGMSAINGVSYQNATITYLTTMRTLAHFHLRGMTHTLSWFVYSTVHAYNYTRIFISRVKYSGVEFATDGTLTLMLYKGAPTCQWKNICEHVKRRPAKERLTTIWFNRPIFGLGLNQ